MARVYLNKEAAKHRKKHWSRYEQNRPLVISLACNLILTTVLILGIIRYIYG